MPVAEVSEPVAEVSAPAVAASAPVAPVSAPGASKYGSAGYAPGASRPATAPASRGRWWIVPLVIVGLVVIAFLLLMGLPFGGRDKDRPVNTAAKTETIAEGGPAPSSAPEQTATLMEVGEEPPPEVLEPTQSMPPDRPAETRAPAQSQPRVVTQPPRSRTVPAETTTQPPARRPAPVQQPPVETPPPPQQTAEIGVSEAMSSVRNFVTSRDYYGVGGDCIGVGSLGYQNVGYTLEVRDTCKQQTLGKWRVDAKTREIFRQREDGRFLRP